MLPQDPYILFSYVNTHLRDHYSSLPAFCEEMDISEGELIAALAQVGFQYDPKINQFR